MYVLGVFFVFKLQYSYTINIHIPNGRLKGRTSSAPISARHLEMDKDQGLRSGILYLGSTREYKRTLSD